MTSLYDQVVIKLKNRLMKDVNTFRKEPGIAERLEYAASLLDDINKWILEAKVQRWEAELVTLKRLAEGKFSAKQARKEVSDRIQELETLIQKAGEEEHEEHRPARKLHISK